VEAAEAARRLGATVRLLHVREVITSSGMSYVEPEAEANAIVERIINLLRESGLDGEGEVVVSAVGVVQAIAEASET
jgi:nucleotide-binding universal stress UspA family protein